MLESGLQRASLIMARIGGGMLLAAALLVAVEVVLRKSRLMVFSLGTELSAYALAVGAAWAFAYVVFERAHVRVDVLTQKMPDLPRAFFNMLALASLAVLGTVLAWSAADTFLQSARLGSRANTSLGTPLAIPQGLWLLGIGWFAFISLYRTATAAGALLRRDLERVSAIAAPASAEDEIEEATAHLGHAVEGRQP